MPITDLRNDSFPFRPRLVETLKNYSAKDFSSDLVAGLTVGIVALPLAMAFGIASGVDPKAGLYTAVIAGFIISALVGKIVPEGVLIFRIFGAFFFGAADKLETALKRGTQEPRVLILRMRKVLAMDATGLNALEDLYEKLRNKNKYLVLSGPHSQPLITMQRFGFLDRLGRENVCEHIDAALEWARQILAETSPRK